MSPFHAGGDTKIFLVFLKKVLTNLAGFGIIYLALREAQQNMGV